MRKGVLKIDNEIIEGKWVGPSTAARINGLSQHYNKCMDNFSITNHKKYRLLTFHGNDLSLVMLTDGSRNTDPENIKIVHGSTLVDLGLAENKNGHTILK